MPTTKPFAIRGRRVAGNPAATAAGRNATTVPRRRGTPMISPSSNVLTALLSCPSISPAAIWAAMT